jgi:hypothetical protein
VKLFLDTSALIKRFVTELGSTRVIQLTAHADALGLSIIALPEALSTLRRLVREGGLAQSDYRSLKSAILAELSDADLCDLTPTALEHTTTCLERNPVRALDAIHIGCARAYQADLFVSADRRQIYAAKREGLRVEDVNVSAR